MTNNEVKYALACIASNEEVLCENCPFHTYGFSSCHSVAATEAIDIINRQETENEMLRGWQELLKAEKHSLIKSAAIKEFAEKLKKKRRRYFTSPNGFVVNSVLGVTLEDINLIVKEMEEV